MTPAKKLIEVALPLDAINSGCQEEKNPFLKGHPRSLHLWWARRPLAAARAVIFAQMVDDPGEYTDELLGDTARKRAAQAELKRRRAAVELLREKARAAGDPGPGEVVEPSLADCAAELERQRLFGLITELVQWENTTNEEVLNRARAEIWQSWRRACARHADHPRATELFDRNKLPAFHDPFAGGGALPLEAQRLGLEAWASDLNPVAVLINKAMIEIPPKFAGREPVNPTWRAMPEQQRMGRDWSGAKGLAEDVRHYGQWIRDEAEKRIGHLYPKVEVTAEMVKERPDLKSYEGRSLTVIAWLWARTVKSPNPAFAQVDVPLASTFMLSTKVGKEAYVEPVIENGGYRFTVKVGKPKDAERAKNGTKLARGANFQCLMSNAPIASDHIYGEANAGRMGARLMAIVAEGDRGRVYLSPTPKMEAVALTAQPTWKPELAMPENPRWFSPPLYGLKTYGDLFTPRQLVALTTFSDLVGEAMEQVRRDALAAGLPKDDQPLRSCGTGTTAYAEAVQVYLACGISQLARYLCTICAWNRTNENVAQAFGRQAIPMVWDHAEANPLDSALGIHVTVGWAASAIERHVSSAEGTAAQSDAQSQLLSTDRLISTDPPYYDNIGYADLSDFFYLWLRRSLSPTFPDLFATLAVPKAEELVATPYRHGSKEKAEIFFLDGMTQAMHRLAEQAHPAFPVTIYYAFKQSESEGDEGTTNTGWDTFLAAVIEAGFAISGTWPVRTEKTLGLKGDVNALASSIVLVCRKRAASSSTASRREFVTALKSELPQALRHLQAGNIAPVDLAQAAIGPGMAVFTRYAKVEDAAGQAMSVRQALALINEVLDETLAEQEGDFDADTRWALAWFEQLGFTEGDYGVAETLSKAKNTSVAGLVEAGLLTSSRGKVRLLKPEELPKDWDPATDKRRSVWEAVHHLVRALHESEGAAAALAAKLGLQADIARELAYRLYVLCERKKRATEAVSYNALVQSWPEITRLAQSAPDRAVQSDAFEENGN